MHKHKNKKLCSVACSCTWDHATSDLDHALASTRSTSQIHVSAPRRASRQGLFLLGPFRLVSLLFAHDVLWSQGSHSTPIATTLEPRASKIKNTYLCQTRRYRGRLTMAIIETLDRGCVPSEDGRESAEYDDHAANQVRYVCLPLTKSQGRPGDEERGKL